MTTQNPIKYTVFSLLDIQSGTLMYIGRTKTTLNTALQNLNKLSRTKTAGNYNTPVSVWLRKMYAEFRVPGYEVLGTYNTLEEAKAKQQELIDANPTCLNVIGNRVPFTKVKK